MPGVAAQMRKQDADAKAFMAKPFVPESSAGSASAALASADPKVLKGLSIFQAQSCSSSHGDGGTGTTAAGPLTGVGSKVSDAQLVALLHAPNDKMISGRMTPIDLKPDDLEALIAHIRQLIDPARLVHLRLPLSVKIALTFTVMDLHHLRLAGLPAHSIYFQAKPQPGSRCT